MPSGSLHITEQGLQAAALLIARVETAVTLTTLLILCTPWMQVLKALRAFHVPQEVVMMLAMTHRYIFLLAETASQMFESRQSRTVGVMDGSLQRRMTARTAGVLLSKSVELEQRSISGHAVARLSRRREDPGRISHARMGLHRTGGISSNRRLSPCGWEEHD